MSGIPDLPGNDPPKYNMAESRAGVIVWQREVYLAIHYQISPPGATCRSSERRNAVAAEKVRSERSC